MNAEWNNLRASIEDLYAIFSSYSSNRDMDRCDHCVTQSAVDRLTAPALRDLNWETVGQYSFNAISTWGNQNDFKHFLPRLLEAVALENYPYNVEIVGGKLRLAEWKNWPASERDAVAAYCESLWICLLHSFPTLDHFPAFAQIGDAVCMFGRALDDLSPFLNTWLMDESAPAHRNLADFVRDNIPSLLKGRGLSNAFWKDCPGTMKQTSDWILSGQVKQKLERGFFLFSSEEFAGEISDAVKMLDWYRPVELPKGTLL